MSRPISDLWRYPKRSFGDRLRGLLGMPQRASRGQWKSWRDSRRELAGRRTPLPFKRAPRTEHVIDPNSRQGSEMAAQLNQNNLAVIARSVSVARIPSEHQQQVLSEARDLSIILGAETEPYKAPEPGKVGISHLVTEYL